MIIERKQLFTVIYAEQDKLITDGQGVFTEIYLPKTFTDDQINAKYSQVDQDNFEVKVSNGIYTKLFIRRACRALGLQDKLNALLASNEYFSADWADAQQINLNDPMFLEALKQGTFTDQEIEAIKKYQ